MKTELKIEKITNAESELHCQYSRQTAPQPIHVELDCTTGILTAAYDPEIGGGVPMAVYNGHTIRWPIGLLMTEAANELLNDLAEDVQFVLDGYESQWDGQAVYSAAAYAARDRISLVCEQTLIPDARNQLSVYDACDWYATGDTPLGWAAEWKITVDTTDKELEELQSRLRDEARGDNVILENLWDFLVECRQESEKETTGFFVCGSQTNGEYIVESSEIDDLDSNIPRRRLPISEIGEYAYAIWEYYAGDDRPELGDKDAFFKWLEHDMKNDKICAAVRESLPENFFLADCVVDYLRKNGKMSGPDICEALHVDESNLDELRELEIIEQATPPHGASRFPWFKLP